MCRRLIHLLCLVLVCGVQISQAADPEEHLVLYLPFDEGSGTVSADESPSGLQATLEGGYEWTAGISGKALTFSAGRAVLSESDPLNLSQITVMAWVNPLSIVAADNPNWYTDVHSIYGKAGNAGDDSVTLGLSGEDGVYFYTDTGGNNQLRALDAGVALGQWQHIAGTFDGTTMLVFVNGEQVGELAASGSIISNPILPTIGGRSDTAVDFDGANDELKVYDRALTPEEIKEAMEVGDPGIAGLPSPPDATTDVPRDVVLGWAPGLFARTHDVYFGTVFDDVNAASTGNPLDVLLGQGQDVNAIDAGRLEFGQTYYWRVDEVNGPPDNTVFKGEVWSFQVEPLSIPVTAISVTASSSHSADMGPEKTVDGSGLNELDQHSVEGTDMWLSGMGDPTPVLNYEFDKPYKLHEMWVWNSNQVIESFVGIGAKGVVIETSVDANEWTVLEGATQLAQAPGAAGYAVNNVLNFGGVLARYVQITITSAHGISPQQGISEIRFLYIPTLAREPQPDDGQAGVPVDAILSWRAGREAAAHEVTLSTDAAAVADGTAPVMAADTSSVDPDGLDLASTYYWQVTEINEAETPAAYTSDIWSFSTQALLVVDDFEGYDDNCNRIFFAWEDGFGHNGGQDIEDCTVPPSNGNGSGSIVGNAQAPFAETSIVRSGAQAMPLDYDGASETTRSFAVAQDWTKHGIRALTLWFQGDSGNAAATLYVKINGTRVDYSGDADNIMRKPWHLWYIDLGTLNNVSLSAVTELTIGVAGGQGRVYIDDIVLTPNERQILTPVEPAPANLIAQYSFEGHANDSAGGLHGSLVGNATFVPGPQGQALSLNTMTVTDYVEITGYKGILGGSAITVAAWINTDSDATGAIMGWGTNVSGQRFGFRVDAGRLRIEHHGGNVQGNSIVNDGVWYHVAVTIQANATPSYPQVQLWLNGKDDSRPSTNTVLFDLTVDVDARIGSRPGSNDRYFIGQIDEVSVYERALSQAEIAWLAGKTAPFDVE